MTHSRRIDRRTHLRIATICLVLVGLAAGTTQAQAAGFGTPQECFDAAKGHLAKKDYEGFCRCLTPDSQNLMAGMFSMLPSMMRSFAALGGEEAIKKIDTQFAKIDEVIKKHGLDASKLPGMPEMMKVQKDEAKMKALFDNMLAPVKDRAAYLAELMKAFESLQDGQPGAPNLAEAIDGDLKDLTVAGDTATGTLVVTRNGDTQEQPFNFKKVDGGWLIDLPIQGPGGA